MRLRASFFVLALAALVAFSACSNSGRLRYNSAEEAYNKGMAEMEDEDYDVAIKFFRGVFQYGRGNEWADDAQFHLAEAYEKQRRYRLAATEYERFTQLYRNNQRVPVAEFRRANMYFKDSPQYQLDQSASRKAIDYYQLFLQRYPQHELATTAQEHISELRNKLAHKKYAAGELYMRRRMYEAATEVYTSLFDQYPDTRWADDALYGAVRAFTVYAENSIASKQEERYRKAVENYDRLVQVFPESKLVQRAASFYKEAQDALDDIGAEKDAQSLAESGDGTSSE